MELYDKVAQRASRQLTLSYSTSFGLAVRLLDPTVRRHVFNIYGLVRLADEIVDTYAADDAVNQLDALEREVYAAMKRHYSTNLIVHAFVLTANEYGISKELIAPFFASMRIDAPGHTYHQTDYAAYIHGSAEVVGLMCLLAFCHGNRQQYEALESGATALGAAFQKVNFLRDMAHDHTVLGRFYFPNMSFETFDDKAKQTIITDIQHDFAVAAPAIAALPKGARTAVAAAANLYKELLRRLERTSASVIRAQRIRVPDEKKLRIFAKTVVTGGRHA